VSITGHELLVICQMCINWLKNKNQTTTINKPVVADHKLPATNDPIANCVWDNVIVSTGQTNMAQRQKKGEQMKSLNSTCLQGFCVNGVVLILAHISNDVMRKWAIAKGRSKARSLSKQKLCKAIIDWKWDHDIAVANGTTMTVYTITQHPL
jgi:hypothetical protein